MRVNKFKSMYFELSVLRIKAFVDPSFRERFAKLARPRKEAVEELSGFKLKYAQTFLIELLCRTKLNTVSIHRIMSLGRCIAASFPSVGCLLF